MELEQERNCSACEYTISHPVDLCPVCGSHFYWKLRTSREPEAHEVDQFCSQMQELAGDRVHRGFLTHGGYLWLPHNFWDKSPDGEALADFDWIEEVDMFQHDEGRVAQPASFSPSKSIKTKPLKPFETESVLPPDVAPLKPKSKTEEKPLRSSWRESSWFRPLMVFLLLLLLSVSYVILRYHKNTRPPGPLSKGIAHEQHQVLS